MQQVNFQNNPVNLVNELPKTGDNAPKFKLCDSTLSDLTLDSIQEKNIVIYVFPSVDTPVCASSLKTLDSLASQTNDTLFLCVSSDLPFAVSRHFSEEDIKNVQAASCFRSKDFSKSYGVSIEEGALSGLTARCVFIIDESRTIKYVDLVAEMTDQPDYRAMQEVLSSLS